MNVRHFILTTSLAVARVLMNLAGAAQQPPGEMVVNINPTRESPRPIAHCCLAKPVRGQQPIPRQWGLPSRLEKTA